MRTIRAERMRWLWLTHDLRGHMRTDMRQNFCQDAVVGLDTIHAIR